MSDPSEMKEINRLDQHIRQSEGGSAKKTDSESSMRLTPGARIGFDFVSAVIAFGLIGWFIDRECGLAPWGLTGMSVVGFIVGIIMAWRELQSPTDTK